MSPADLPAKWASMVALAENGCWHWTGRINPDGYGGARHKGDQLAHRVIYKTLVGPIPDGLTLDHQCHNADTSCRGGRTCLHRRCVNPAHLDPTDNGENTRRGKRNNSRRVNWDEGTCQRGHARAEHTRVDSCGRRYCYPCRLTSNLEACERYRARKRGEIVSVKPIRTPRPAPRQPSPPPQTVAGVMAKPWGWAVAQGAEPLEVQL